MIRIEIDGVKTGDAIHRLSSTEVSYAGDLHFFVNDEEELEKLRTKSRERATYVGSYITDDGHTFVVYMDDENAYCNGIKAMGIGTYANIFNATFFDLSGNDWFRRGICNIRNNFIYDLKNKTLTLGDPDDGEVNLANEFLSHWVTPIQQIKNVDGKYEVFTI